MDPTSVQMLLPLLQAQQQAADLTFGTNFNQVKLAAELTTTMIMSRIQTAGNQLGAKYQNEWVDVFNAIHGAINSKIPKTELISANKEFSDAINKILTPPLISVPQAILVNAEKIQ